MVAAGWGFDKGLKYNQHLMDGYYRCDNRLVQGLSNTTNDYIPSCYCNPNYEWGDYKQPKPVRHWGLTASVPYEGEWIDQAGLDEMRNCDGLVAIVDIWKSWQEKS